MRTQYDKLEKFRLNFSRCTNRDVAPLNFYVKSNLTQISGNPEQQEYEDPLLSFSR